MGDDYLRGLYDICRESSENQKIPIKKIIKIKEKKIKKDKMEGDGDRRREEELTERIDRQIMHKVYLASRRSYISYRFGLTISLLVPVTYFFISS